MLRHAGSTVHQNNDMKKAVILLAVIVLILGAVVYSFARTLTPIKYIKAKIHYKGWFVKTEEPLTPEAVRRNPEMETVVNDGDAVSTLTDDSLEVREFLRDYWDGGLQELDAKEYDQKLIQVCMDNEKKRFEPGKDLKFLQAYVSIDGQFWYFEFEGLWATDIRIVYVYSVKDKKFIGRFNIPMA